MKPTVYIETTIPSYYCDERSGIRDAIMRTRQWWDHERGEYDCFISATVTEELSKGHYPNQGRCLELIEGIAELAVTEEILEVAEYYWRCNLMPAPPSADAYHVALASVYRMEFLLTWNCRHLANVRKADHLARVNHKLGLTTPRLVTPEMLRLEE